VDVGGCEVFQALVIALVVVAYDEPADAGFEIARQVVVNPLILSQGADPEQLKDMWYVAYSDAKETRIRQIRDSDRGHCYHAV
jgi:hypothetical protein